MFHGIQRDSQQLHSEPVEEMIRKKRTAVVSWRAIVVH